MRKLNLQNVAVGRLMGKAHVRNDPRLILTAGSRIEKNELMRILPEARTSPFVDIFGMYVDHDVVQCSTSLSVSRS